MNLFLNISEALSAIKSNLLRTVFTVLIITIGIFALIGILTTIEGLKNSIQSNLSALGSNVFEVQAKGFSNRWRHGKRPEKIYPPISYKQAMAYKERYRYPSSTSLSAFASGNATVKWKSKKTNPNIQVIGADQQYFTCESLNIIKGRNFSNAEVSNGSNVAVIGYEIYEKLFGKSDAIEHRISLFGKKYKVVGILENKGAFMGGAGGSRSVIIPLQNVRQLSLYSRLTFVIKTLIKDSEKMEEASDEATGIMKQIRKDAPGSEDSFEITESTAMVRSLDQISGILQSGAFVISIITLIGACIALINIMLVSVTERTREIGIRKALGATPYQIALQFLIEAILICVIGGVLGIVVGALLGNVISWFMGSFQFYFPWLPAFGSVIACILIGTIAGFLPAVKGARMDPIDSLRYE